MSNKNPTLSARDITSEEQLNTSLEKCGISSSSPKDVEWLFHWWEKEFEPNSPPLARHVVVVGDEKVALDLCIAVENKIVFYAFNDHNYWFNRLDAVAEFSSCEELNSYLNKLANQYLIDWKKWMKENRL